MPAAVRRLPAALLVALATALVFGGLLGTASAASGDGPDDGMMRVPLPAVGDRWTYQALVEGPWNFGPEDDERAGAPFPYAELAWSEPLVIRDGDGAEASVDVLSFKGLDYHDDPDSADYNDGQLWVPSEERYLVRTGTTEVVAYEQPIASDDQGGNGAGLVVIGNEPLIQAGEVEKVEGWGRFFNGFGVQSPCLARTALQGEAYDLDRHLRVAADCLPRFPEIEEDGDDGGLDWDWEEDVSDGGTYRFAGREVVAGRSAVRFDRTGGGVSLWLSEEVPVPVQWTARSDRGSISISLSSFSAGTVPLGSVVAPTAGSVAPPVVMAPRQLWGPDDSGVGHPFPASAAFQAARTDPRWPDLRTWLASHPDGTTFMLEYAEELDAMPQERSWTFALSDGSDSMAFMATQATQETPAGLSLPPTVQFQDLGYMASWLDIFAPDPDALPDDLPTVASVTARWASYETLEGRTDEPNGWGMFLTCVLDCSWGLYGEVVAGKDPVAFFHMAPGSAMPNAGLPQLADSTFTGSQLNVGPDGRTAVAKHWTGYASGLSVGPLDEQPIVDAEPQGASGRKDPVVLAAFLPSPEQGAAITAASALAGLLYWLWPSLKGGAAGLFSRVSGQRLLDHPARARLLQIIQAEPGVHFQDLVRRASLPNGTAVHHLHKLEQGGLIAARPLGRYTCYFPGSSPDRASLAAAPVTRSEGAKRILAELAASPGLSGQEVALRLGLQPSTVAYHVKRLQEAGLVAAARDGRAIRLRTLGGAAGAAGAA